MADLSAMRDVCVATPNGDRESRHLPANWKRRSGITPFRSCVTVDHYIAGDSEIIDLETTGIMFAMYLRLPASVEIRADGCGWTTKHLQTPLIYTPKGFSFSSRWSSEVEWIIVHFEKSWLHQVNPQINEQWGSAMPRFDISDDLLMQIIKSIHEDSVLGMPSGPMHSEVLGAAALNRIMYLDSRPRAKEHIHAPMMRKAAQYIQDNFRSELTLLAVANAIEYPGDLFSFIRNFKKINELPPHQYIIETRLQAARHLIASGRLDVTQAALDCGFSTPSHFSTAFRKRWKMSPSELKPNLANASAAK